MSEEIENVEPVEETVETTESDTFDASAFGANLKEAAEDETEEQTEETTSSQEEADEDDDSFSWDSVSTEEEEEESEQTEEASEPADEWSFEEEVEDSEESGVVDTSGWENLADSLGVDADSYDDLVQQLNTVVNPEPVNDKINALNSYLNYTDKQLVQADLMAQGLTKEEAAKEVQNLGDIGFLKREALQLRRDIRNAVRQEEANAKEEAEREEQAYYQEISDNKAALQGYLKEKDRFFGGKVTKKEREELYKYITSGRFDEDLRTSHANVADMAFLWKNHKKIFKMLHNEGVERGKSAVLDKITSPNLGRRSSTPRVKSKSDGFDASEFMAQ